MKSIEFKNCVSELSVQLQVIAEKYSQTVDAEKAQASFDLWLPRATKQLQRLGLTDATSGLSKRSAGATSMFRHNEIGEIMSECITFLKELERDVAYNVEQYFPLEADADELRMNGGRDTAQVCLNGHVITWASILQAADRKKHCTKCGASTITCCQLCETKIDGYDAGLVERLSLPDYCGDCGQPFPWTQKRQVALEQLIDMLSGSSESEKDELKALIPALAREIPETSVAIVRYRQVMPKFLAFGTEVAKGIFVEVCKHEVLQKIFGGQ